MNEELQKLLIETLKDLRTNANPAFQELVNQYSSMHMVYVLLSIPLFIAAIVTNYFSVKCYQNNNNDDTFMLIVAASACLYTSSFIVFGLNIGQALYPLGNVLGKLG